MRKSLFFPLVLCFFVVFPGTRVFAAEDGDDPRPEPTELLKEAYKTAESLNPLKNKRWTEYELNEGNFIQRAETSRNGETETAYRFVDGVSPGEPECSVWMYIAKAETAAGNEKKAKIALDNVRKLIPDAKSMSVLESHFALMAELGEKDAADETFRKIVSGYDGTGPNADERRFQGVIFCLKAGAYPEAAKFARNIEAPYAKAWALAEIALLMPPN